MDTVYTVIRKSLAMAEELGQDDVVIVADQAIYAKMKEICWNKAEELNRVVVRLGAFHLSCTFMCHNWQTLADAGLGDLVVESGLCGLSAVNAVMEGRQYNRAVRVHKLVCEALQRARCKEFERTLLPDDTDLRDVKQSIISLRENLNCENIKDVEKSPSYDGNNPP